MKNWCRENSKSKMADADGGENAVSENANAPTQFGITRTGKEKLIYDSFEFHQNKVSANRERIFWECAQRRHTLCKARLCTDAQGSVLDATRNHHNHDAQGVLIGGISFEDYDAADARDDMELDEQTDDANGPKKASLKQQMRNWERYKLEQAAHRALNRANAVRTTGTIAKANIDGKTAESISAKRAELAVRLLDYSNAPRGEAGNAFDLEIARPKDVQTSVKPAEQCEAELNALRQVREADFSALLESLESKSGDSSLDVDENQVAFGASRVVVHCWTLAEVNELVRRFIAMTNTKYCCAELVTDFGTLPSPANMASARRLKFSSNGAATIQFDGTPYIWVDLRRIACCCSKSEYSQQKHHRLVRLRRVLARMRQIEQGDAETGRPAHTLFSAEANLRDKIVKQLDELENHSDLVQQNFEFCEAHIYISKIIKFPQYKLLSGDDVLGRAYLENVWRRDWLNRRVSVVGQVQYVVQLPALAEHNHSADQKLAMHGLVPRDARPELDMRGLSGCRLWRGHKIAPADVDPAVVDFIRSLVITQQLTDIDTIQKQIRDRYAVETGQFPRIHDRVRNPTAPTIQYIVEKILHELDKSVPSPDVDVQLEAQYVPATNGADGSMLGYSPLAKRKRGRPRKDEALKAAYLYADTRFAKVLPPIRPKKAHKYTKLLQLGQTAFDHSQLCSTDGIDADAEVEAVADVDGDAEVEFALTQDDPVCESVTTTVDISNVAQDVVL